MDALFYWLQMKLVSEARPQDTAAAETVRFFAQILAEDHGVTSFDVVSMDDAKIHVSYRQPDGSSRTVWFDREAAEQLLHQPILSKEELEAEKERDTHA
jgi:hypothetical protein